MQVRTGKTLTAMQTCKLYGAKNVLFVTKKKAIQSIKDDFFKMFLYDFDLEVINYESLHKLNIDIEYDVIVCDEAHTLGQFPLPSERTKYLKRLCYNKPVIFLSGTPSPESYSQLFHQFWISNHSPFGHSTFYHWAREGYVFPKNKYVFNRTIPDYSDANVKLIVQKTGHLFLSYTQEEAGFTQLVEEVIHNVEIDAMTRVVIKRLKKDKVVIGKQGQEILADTELKLMQKMHQLYSGTVIPDSNHDTIIVDCSKAEYIFKNFCNKKIAIFYKFRAEADVIKDEAKKNGLMVTENPAEFNYYESDIVFISQVQSGREGINLSTADCLVMYNIDFSAVSYWQVRARLQSKDRIEPAMVHWIFAKDGIEHNIYKAVSNKKDYTLNYFKKDYNEK